MKHVHAELMMEYAKDAMESETPWVGWEFRVPNKTDWAPCIVDPQWNPDAEYRRKPKVPMVAGVEFPDMILSFEDTVEGRSVFLVRCFTCNYDFMITAALPQHINHVDYLRGWVHRTHYSASKYINLIKPKVQ